MTRMVTLLPCQCRISKLVEFARKLLSFKLELSRRPYIDIQLALCAFYWSFLSEHIERSMNVALL